MLSKETNQNKNLNPPNIPPSDISETGGNFRGVMANVLDCGFKISELELHSSYYVPFRPKNFAKGKNPLSPSPAMDEIVPLLFLYKDGFGIKQPSNVDMPLN